MLRGGGTTWTAVAAVGLARAITLWTSCHALISGRRTFVIGDCLGVLRGVGRLVVAADALETQRVLERLVSTCAWRQDVSKQER